MHLHRSLLPSLARLRALHILVHTLCGARGQTIVSMSRDLSDAVSMLRRPRPLRVGLKGGEETLKSDSGSEQTKQHASFPPRPQLHLFSQLLLPQAGS